MASSAPDTPDLLVPITTPPRPGPWARIAPAIGSAICDSAASAIALLRQSNAASRSGIRGSGSFTAPTRSTRWGARSSRSTSREGSPSSNRDHTSSALAPSAVTIPSALRRHALSDGINSIPTRHFASQHRSPAGSRQAAGQLQWPTEDSDMRSIIVSLGIGALLLAPAASFAAAAKCSNGKSTDAAMWYSLLHPGVGEWYLRNWGSFN